MWPIFSSIAARWQVRHQIILILFAITVINYADRAIISITGTSISKDLGITPVTLGYIFSAFSWAYVLAQMPGGWLLDRYGAKRVYAIGIFVWSIFTFAQGWVGVFGGGAVILLFTFRFLVGAAEAPSFPANARIVAAWFPTAERGMASALFNSAQYFAPVLFLPLTSWLTQSFGWPSAFIVMGVLGMLFVLVWQYRMYAPKDHPSVAQTEVDFIERGGALMSMDRVNRGLPESKTEAHAFQMLMTNRMLLGIYLAQYFINAITYFFLTWFPIYLVKEKGLTILQAGFVASLPALCGFFGGVLGGIISDYLFRKKWSLTLARKIPIVCGMLLSMSIIACNYVESPIAVVSLMALAFFGKGVGALGWAVVSDTAPKNYGGLCGGIFNMFGNVAGITTPIVIGYILQATGSFNYALIFIGLNAFGALASYLLIVGEIKRVEI